jgi:hypothetical protein
VPLFTEQLICRTVRTILGGIRALRRAPLAVVPLALEGVVGGLLVGSGAWPAGAASAPATAVFPLDIFFDLKQALAFGSDWSWVVAAALLAILVRGAVLAATLWLGDGAAGPFVDVWTRVCRLAGIAILALFPSAALFFIGVATRYAPFVWMAAILGFVPAAVIARKAVRLDAGRGGPSGRGVPEVPAFLAYAYLVSGAGAAMSVLEGSSSWAAAALVAWLGPVHALFVLGWREHLRAQTYPGGGTLALAVTVVALGALTVASVYDRYIRDPAPVARVSQEGSLLLIGGADSTSTTGALIGIDARDLGFRRELMQLLSYGFGPSYTAEDTRGDLRTVADLMVEQIADAEPPRAVLGHSQASLIVDAMLSEGVDTLDRVVVLAPSLPLPPSIDIPDPDESGPGKAGGDVARGFARLLDVVGLTPFDVDAPASPTNLSPAVVRDADVPRLAVWALADSVWLEGDWRRPGEINMVALTDHVGVTNNSRAFSAARDFLAGEEVSGDEASWRGLLVSAFRYAFEPWRPR